MAEGAYPGIDAILVRHCDTLVVEEYYNDFRQKDRHDMRSSFKSITSLLTGIAIDEGLLSLDDDLAKFFPELKGQPKGKVQVRHLLEMRSGFDCEEFYDIGPDCESAMMESDDWIAHCLNVPLYHPPGTNWSYNSHNPMLVGEIIARASGMSIMEFAKTKLFLPLGITNYKWTISPQGRGMTAGSFYLRPIDMLKIAQLVAQEGMWEGQQVVSKNWINTSTNCTIDIDFSFTRYSRMAGARYESARYGFYWYREKIASSDFDTEVLFASGNGGQYMMLLSEYNAQVVFTGSNYGNWRGKLPFEILLRYVLPILESQACN